MGIFSRTGARHRRTSECDGGRMSTYVFKLPDIGEGIAESEIAQWHVAVGDVVEEDAQLVDILTDKAAVELSSPVAGRVLQIHGCAANNIPVGGPRVTLDNAPLLPE